MFEIYNAKASSGRSNVLLSMAVIPAMYLLLQAQVEELVLTESEESGAYFRDM